jgi:hypothetical protein
MNPTIKVRITRRCTVGRDVAEVGAIVTLEAADAAGVLASGRGVALDPDAAKEAMIDATNDALRIEKSGQRRTTPPWVRRVA